MGHILILKLKFGENWRKLKAALEKLNNKKRNGKRIWALFAFYFDLIFFIAYSTAV